MRASMLVAVLLSLAACGSAQQAEPEPPTMPVSETVFAPAVSALDKARSVEGALQQDKEKTDAAIESAQ